MWRMSPSATFAFLIVGIFQWKVAGFCNLDGANLVCFEIQEVSSISNRHLLPAIRFRRCLPQAFAATLNNLCFEFRGVSNFDVPRGPVFEVCPVTNVIFVRLQFVPQQFSVSDHIVGPQYN